MVRLALVGYGKMNREIHSLAKNFDSDVRTVFHSRSPVTVEGLREVDVCIDFSHPEAVIPNARIITSAGKKLVIGTTGWYDDLPVLEKIIENESAGVIYSPNFSLGVYLFYEVASFMADLMNHQEEYDVAVEEKHHALKRDLPSGTALHLAHLILKNISRKKKTALPPHPCDPEILSITAARSGYYFGEHSLVFDAEVDTLSLTHRAKNRRGFCEGALKAAFWISQKKGLYTIKDLFEDLITTAEL